MCCLFLLAAWIPVRDPNLGAVIASPGICSSGSCLYTEPVILPFLLHVLARWYVCVFEWERIYVEALGRLWVSSCLDGSWPYFLIVIAVNLESNDSAIMAATNLKALPLPYLLQCWGYRGTLPHLYCHLDAKDTDSGLHGCVVQQMLYWLRHLPSLFAE